jgi:hypothetical protein
LSWQSRQNHSAVQSSVLQYRVTESDSVTPVTEVQGSRFYLILLINYLVTDDFLKPWTLNLTGVTEWLSVAPVSTLSTGQSVLIPVYHLYSCASHQWVRWVKPWTLNLEPWTSGYSAKVRLVTVVSVSTMLRLLIKLRLTPEYWSQWSAQRLQYKLTELYQSPVSNLQ